MFSQQLGDGISIGYLCQLWIGRRKVPTAQIPNLDRNVAHCSSCVSLSYARIYFDVWNKPIVS